MHRHCPPARRLTRLRTKKRRKDSRPKVAFTSDSKLRSGSWTTSSGVQQCRPPPPPPPLSPPLSIPVLPAPKPRLRRSRRKSVPRSGSVRRAQIQYLVSLRPVPHPLQQPSWSAQPWSARCAMPAPTPAASAVVVTHQRWRFPPSSLPPLPLLPPGANQSESTLGARSRNR